MDIQLNGEPRTLTDACTLADLLHQEHLEGHRIAIEVNGELIDDARYATRALSDGDQVEVIHAIGAQ